MGLFGGKSKALLSENKELKRIIRSQNKKISRLIARSDEKDSHFMAMISDGLRHGSSLAAKYMSELKDEKRKK